MQILVDADACPVKEIIIKLAKQYQLSVTMIIDTSHELNDGYSKVIVVEQGRDSVDLKLVNLLQPGDLVVTQDYGVAAMALGKKAQALNQNGLIYTNENIDQLLFERHLGQKLRRAGGKMSSHKKRTQADDMDFQVALEKIIVAELNKN